MRLTLNLPPQDLAEVARQAARLGITQEELVVQIITQKLAEIQEERQRSGEGKPDAE